MIFFVLGLFGWGVTLLVKLEIVALITCGLASTFPSKFKVKRKWAILPLFLTGGMARLS